MPTSMVVELNKSMQMGIPWRVALAEITEGTDLEDVAAFVDDGSLANWIWLVDLERRDRALDVCGGDGTMTASLARHFAAVYFLEPDHSLLSFSQKRFAQDGIGNVVLLSASEQDLPFRHGSFDCIVLHEVFDRYGLPAGRAQTDSDHRALLTACHRLLRPGGYLCVGATNPYWREPWAVVLSSSTAARLALAIERVQTQLR